jgi:hypothetical protein
MALHPIQKDAGKRRRSLSRYKSRARGGWVEVEILAIRVGDDHPNHVWVQQVCPDTGHLQWPPEQVLKSSLQELEN